KFTNPLYGQLIVGPPGSGKTTYCQNAFKFYQELGRSVAIVNLDPANENMEYTAAIDVMELITVQDVMDNMHLGPNGALINTESMLRLRNHIDKANGYIYKAGEEQSVNALMACAVGAESEAQRQSKDIDPYL
ncbi:hypothetical protein DOY81_012380, partial [Sarcophaga bullata]